MKEREITSQQQMKMRLPSGRRVQEPLLLFIYYHGGTDYQIHARDSYEPVADFLNLSPEERTITRHDRNPDDNKTESDWHNRVQFARRDLVNLGYFDNSTDRGIWKLSKDGISAAQRLIKNNSDLANRIRLFGSVSDGAHLKNEVSEIKDQIEQIIHSKEKELTVAKQFDPENIMDSRERTLASVVQRRGQPEFRQRLLDIYKGACAISGYDAFQALEAAHIIPYQGVETNHPKNGILLRSDLHTLFDLRLISINTETMTVLVSPELLKTIYAQYQGKLIFIPQNPEEKPSIEALNKHRKESNL